MKNIYFKSLALLLLVTGSAFAQIGVNTTAPASTLDVVATNATGTTTNVDGITIPRVTRERAQSMVSVPTSTMIYVTEVTTGSTTGTTANVTAIGFYFFNGTLWEKINTGTPSADWSLTGNSGTTAGTNYIGTNDVQDLVVKTSAVANTPLERMRVTSAGNVGINAPTPTANALLTINPNTNAISSGIDMTMTNANSAATGLNINADNANVNGIAVTHSSTSSSSSFYGIGSVLSATNIVSGYNGYRNGSGLSYGLYGINGTTGTYATNANTWAAFLRGRTVISSEGSPSSPVGTDLEVRNTTTGSAAPATVSLRQSTSLPTNGNVLANLNFGDNYTTAPQAQIRVLRDAAAGSATDMPTAMTFSTTPDASSTLTERMRIFSGGRVGINTTANLASEQFLVQSTGYSVNGNSTGNGSGVYGLNAGTGDGVVGGNDNNTGAGVYGYSTHNSGVGVFSEGNNVTGLFPAVGSGGAFNGYQYGVYANATISGNGATDRAAFIGTFNQNAAATTVYLGARIGGNNYKVLGTGSASVSTTMPTRDGERILFAPEAPENWFFDIGEVTLVNGKAEVTLDPIFVDCIADSKPFKVFVQGAEDTLGSIRVVRNQETKTFILEDMGGASNGTVQYSIYAIWKQKENLRFPNYEPQIKLEKAKRIRKNNP